MRIILVQHYLKAFNSVYHHDYRCTYVYLHYSSAYYHCHFSTSSDHHNHHCNCAYNEMSRCFLPPTCLSVRH